MIGVVAPGYDRAVVEIVVAALARSVTRAMVKWISPTALNAIDFVVAINPDEATAEELKAWLSKGKRKLILLGRLPATIQSLYDLEQAGEWPEHRESWARSVPAEVGKCAASIAKIDYSPNASAFEAAGWSRPLERFDFSDEWNNLGFGALRLDDSIWAISQPLIAPQQNVLASLVLKSEVLSTFCALFDFETSSTLWINRSVGTVDSFEWRLVELFISGWRIADAIPCRPVLSELPFGYDAAVTMRLDCDEDIKSSAFLLSAYQAMDVPLSLAIHTTHLSELQNCEFLREFCRSGGAVLSHTATHAPNWGGSYEAALIEATTSRRTIENIIDKRVGYAVSPFHQSPDYALKALVDAGYFGCIGGIIRNDPEFLIARGGELASLPNGFVGHSQQCMLHGDCLLLEGDPIAIYKAAFDQAWATRSLFGYLDHPFSERYQYGWKDEESRADVHKRLITYIRSKANRPLFMSEIEAMEFLSARASLAVTPCDDHFVLSGSPDAEAPRFGYEYAGELKSFANGVTVR